MGERLEDAFDDVMEDLRQSRSAITRAIETLEAGDVGRAKLILQASLLLDGDEVPEPAPTAKP